VGYSTATLGVVAVLLAVLVAALLVLLPRLVRVRLPRLNGRTLPTVLQVAGSVLVLVALVMLTLPAVRHGMPPQVDLPRNLGWPALLLAGLALVLLPVAGGPAAHAGAALFLATYPFVIYNPLNSAFWPSRTIVLLGAGTALLVGVAGQRLADTWGLAEALRRRWTAGARSRPRSVVETRRVSLAAFVLPALLVGSTLGTAVLAGTPEPYETGWYRYFNACEFSTLRSVAYRANADPQAVVITGDWEGKLVVAAFAENEARIWYKQEEFGPSFDHATEDALAARGGHTLYFVVDRYLADGDPHASAAFLQQPPYQLVTQACPSQGGQDRIAVYEYAAGAG
jgi:hypothetical protein